MTNLTDFTFQNRTAALLVGRGFSIEDKGVYSLMEKNNSFKVCAFSEIETLKNEGWSYSCNV
jgi:hypothetical protein